MSAGDPYRCRAHVKVSARASYPALERKNGYESRVQEKHKLENKELVSAILG
jgi:hypothetical protein